MELTLTAGYWIKFCTYLAKLYAPLTNAIRFMPLPIDMYNDRLLQLIRQFLIIPKRTNKLWISLRTVLPPALITSAGI
jgi:hypothetical protein